VCMPTVRLQCSTPCHCHLICQGVQAPPFMACHGGHSRVAVPALQQGQASESCQLQQACVGNVVGWGQAERDKLGHVGQHPCGSVSCG
jgi:hypothetical protein